MRILISGYYGFGNIGDEAILAALVEQLRQLPGPPEIEVLSASPPDTARAYSVGAVNRWRLQEVWRAVRRCDLLLQGGGGLIQDATSWASPGYYLGLLELARLAKRPYVIFAQGIGPLRSPFWRKLTVRAYAAARFVTVRDRASAEALSRWGFAGAVLAADPALLLQPAETEQTERWLASCGLRLPPEYAVLVPRAVPECEPALLEVGRSLAKLALPVVTLPFQPSDEAISRETAAKLSVSIAVPPPPHPAIALSVIRGAAVVVSMRLHGLIFAATGCRPALGLAHDPKLASFCDEAGYPHLDPRAPDAVAKIAAASPAGPDKQAVAALLARARISFERLEETFPPAARA